jgi:hypothetical protein
VARGEQDAASGLAQADDMAGCGSGQDAVLADEQLLDAVRGADLGNQLDDLGVPEAAITTNDEESA